jgi:pimeloyl-ACP methyl ester carboxylesterase
MDTRSLYQAADEVASHRPGALPRAVSGDLECLRGRSGDLAFYVAGSGSPLLLIHSINAAASAYEIRPVFERMRATRRVFAPDLPGFGFSDRSPRRYDVRLFTDAVHDMLDRVAEEAGDRPVDALAVSLSSEFLARAAAERPERFRTLTLVTPTGFNRMSAGRRGPPMGTREVPGLHRILSVGLWSDRLYRGLTRPGTIRYFLKRTYGSDRVDEDMVAYDAVTVRQPGARHAPLAFLSGRLFSADIRDVYERLDMPVWVPHATRGDFKDFSQKGWAEAKGNWAFEPFAAGALPHFEHPDAFMASFSRHLAARPEPVPRTAEG